MADQAETGFTQEQLFKHLLAASIRTEAAINALVHSQAALLAKAYDTEHEHEANQLAKLIEEQKEDILAQSVNGRDTTPLERAKVRSLRGSGSTSVIR